jgi:hypothetical protein
VCNDQSNLIVSTYLNTKGLRSGPGRNNRPDGERLVGLKVNPATTVPRLILDKLLTTGNGADPVAIQARFLKDVAGLLTQSPQANVLTDRVAEGCPNEDEEQQIADSINLPLLDPPPDNRTGMAAYVASQLFLAGLKGGAVALPGVDTTTLPSETEGCTEAAPQAQTAQDFQIVLQGYLNTRTVTKDSLVRLGLQRDDGIATSAATPGCG